MGIGTVILLVALFLGVGVLAVSALGGARSRGRMRERLEEDWGRVRSGSDRGDNEPDAELWIVADGASAGDRGLDDQAWGDLEIDRLLPELDHTLTGLGRQFLYRQLRRARSWGHTPELETLARRFSEDPDSREAVGLVLARGGRGLGPGLWTSMSPPPPPPPTAWLVFPPLGLGMLGLLLAIPAEPRLLLPAVGLALLNMAICALTAPRMNRVMAPLRQVGQLLVVVDGLLALDPALPGSEEARACRRRMTRLGQVARWVRRSPHDSDDVWASLRAYLNLLFLLDPNALLLGTRGIRRRAGDISDLAHWVGEVDFARSVASLRAEPRVWVRPERSTSRGLVRGI